MFIFKKQIIRPLIEFVKTFCIKNNTNGNSKVFIIITLMCVTNIVAQTNKKQSLKGEPTIYKVAKAKAPIIVDGRMDEADWANAEAKTFDYFYNVQQPSDKQKTTFRMLWDNENLYVFFQCEDEFIVARETQRDGVPYFDDCAEIFLIPVPDSLDTHFGFEINLNKASNDFISFQNYYKNKSVTLKTYNPNFKVAVNYEGTINNNTDRDNGWTMEIAIPIAEFGSLAKIVPAEVGNRWTFLAIRQDRNDLIGNRRTTSTLFPTKRVHNSERFGKMEFIE